MNAQASKASKDRRYTQTLQSNAARSLRSRARSSASTDSSLSETFSTPGDPAAEEGSAEEDDCTEPESQAEDSEKPEVIAPSDGFLQGLDEPGTDGEQDVKDVNTVESCGHQAGHKDDVQHSHIPTPEPSTTGHSIADNRESFPMDITTPVRDFDIHSSGVDVPTPNAQPESPSPRVVEVDDDDYNAVNYIPDDDDDGNDDSIELLEEQDIIQEEAKRPAPRIEDFMDEPDEISHRFSMELEMLSAEEDPASPVNRMELDAPSWNMFQAHTPLFPARKRVRFDETAEHQNTLRGFKAGADQWAVPVEDLSPSMRRMIDGEDNGFSTDDSGDTTDEEMPVWVPSPAANKPTPPRTRSKAKSPRRPLGSGPAIGKFVVEVDSDASICIFNGRTKQIDIITPRKRQTPLSGMSSVTCSTAGNSPRTPMLQLDDVDSDGSPTKYFSTDVMLAGQFNNIGSSGNMFGARVGPPESFMPSNPGSEQSWFDLSDPFTAFDGIGFDEAAENDEQGEVNMGEFLDLEEDDDVAIDDATDAALLVPTTRKRKASSSFRRGSYSVESSKVGAFRRNQEAAKRGGDTRDLEASRVAFATLAEETLMGLPRTKKKRRMSSMSHGGRRFETLFEED
ncbi:hypothetical protein P152DRAFT_447389 [Eremomyces bilateralis CBS 781.70]|uniref:Uncharacterized protein n=1 Tax=Eremomyces bilateralis CBS 781.70 TaxID=1392243 RepID=A0A6G1GB28_9PEZI|nr:uncharacterized protein P152DRAFT_447389 [Eremomyces bilateralis CBS 781.70]KAF1815136.1 hypothetical protein P152DRAFT_447389 [Eremomyces bilateralis CBS 781.70]